MRDYEVISTLCVACSAVLNEVLGFNAGALPRARVFRLLPLQPPDVRMLSFPAPSAVRASKVLGPHLPGLCDSMLSTALFDREVNVRRAAAAALQASVRDGGGACTPPRC